MTLGNGRKITFGLILTGLVLVNLLALEDAAKLLPKIADQPVSFAPESDFQVATRQENGSYQELISHSQVIETAQYFDIHVTSPLGRAFYRFDHIGNLVEYESTIPQQGNNSPQANSQFWVSLHRIRPDFYQQSQRLSDGRLENRDVTLNNQEILIAQLPYTLQKAIKAKQTTGLNLVGVIDASMRLNFDIRFFVTNNPMVLVKQYQYPELISKAFRSQEISIVAEVAPTGFISLVYPHKIYFAYGPAPEYVLVAFWGGDPQKAFFQVRTE